MRAHRRRSPPRLLLAVLGVLAAPAGAAAHPTHQPGQNPLRDVLRFLGEPETARRHRTARLASRPDRPRRFAARRPRVVVPADLYRAPDEDGYEYREFRPAYGPYGGYRIVVYPAIPYGAAPPGLYYVRPDAYRPTFYRPYVPAPYFPWGR